jgi:hypothetical protein
MHASSSRGGILHFRSNGDIGAERTPENPIGIYTLTPERIRCLPEEEVAARRRTAEAARGTRFRELYAMLGRQSTRMALWSYEQEGSYVVRRIKLTIRRWA